MNEIEEIKKAEKKGRDIVYNLIKGKVRRYEFTEITENVDLFITGKTDIVLVEIKDREDYSTDKIEKLGGQWIEKHKYDDMMRISKKGYTPYFLAIFSDKIVLWRIDTLDIVWEKREVPVTTFGKKKGEMKIEDIGHLYLKDAVAKFSTKKYKI